MTKIKTEADWWACTYPKTMLTFIWGKVSDRKIRFFATACCRRTRPWLVDERSRAAVDVAEAYADGQATDDQLWQAHEGAEAAYNAACEVALDTVGPVDRTGYGVPRTPEEKAAFAAFAAAFHEAGADHYDCELGLGTIDLYTAAFRASSYAAGAVCLANNASKIVLNNEFATHATILRDIVGNPFRSVNITESWLVYHDGMVPKLAQTLYEERSFDSLPALANALVAAGCDIQDVLDHCRGPGPHVQGCWVVDLLLGRK